MKSTRGQGLKGFVQQGFTLVELAIVLVIAGIILVGVLKGTDSINKAKVERMVADIKGLQASILEFQKRSNRMPGDCNNNGVIELALPVAAAQGVNNTLDKVIRDPSVLAVCGATAASSVALQDDTISAPLVASGVAAGSTTVPANAANAMNLSWNEMRRAGVVDGNRTNEELGRHMFNDVYAIGSMATNAAGTPPPNANVIVIYGIPVWMAEAIDAEIDGVATNYGDNGTTGPAATGRVRLWSNGAGSNVTAGTASGSGSTLLTASPAFNAAPVGQYGTDRDALVSISYQFDTMKLNN